MQFKLFTTPFCPNCPSVKAKVQDLAKKMTDFTGEYIDASTPSGFAQAKQFQVFHVPTVIFMEREKEEGRAHSVPEVEKIIKSKFPPLYSGEG